MNLTNLTTIKKLCQQYNVRPSKRLGQNFLINREILNKIVTAGELKKDDVVLEIGPGFGVLTLELVGRVKQEVAVEKDKRLCEFIKTLKHKNIKTISGDILNLPIDKIFSNSTGSFDSSTLRSDSLRMTSSYKLISNLPYQITSPVLWKFLHYEKDKPELIVLMMQKEVAERIISKPGKMSVLSVMCQFYADCEIVSLVGKENFYPIPDVDSAIITLKHLNTKTLKHKINEKEFIRIVKIGFSAKRKMLKNNLANGLKIPQDKVVKIFKKMGLDEKVRAQELSVENWFKLYKNLCILDRNKN